MGSAIGPTGGSQEACQEGLRRLQEACQEGYMALYGPVYDHMAVYDPVWPWIDPCSGRLGRARSPYLGDGR